MARTGRSGPRPPRPFSTRPGATPNGSLGAGAAAGAPHGGVAEGPAHGERGGDVGHGGQGVGASGLSGRSGGRRVWGDFKPAPGLTMLEYEVRATPEQGTGSSKAPSRCGMGQHVQCTL